MSFRENLVVGGMPVGRDGRVHTTFTHNPSTLRLSSVGPNLQNIPRGSDELSRWVKECFVADPGTMFWARDFSGIEAVLVGYLAGDRDYTRLAKIDVHSFYTAHALHMLDGRLSANDLPQLGWDDVRLTTRLKEIKKEFKAERNSLYKHLIHGANFLQGPVGAQEKIFAETGKAHPVKLVGQLMGIYFELFPKIRVWHQELCERVDGTRRKPSAGIGEEEQLDAWTLGVCYAQNPFGYIHRFYNVLNWTQIDGKWYSEKGEDAKRLVAFLPQSTASAIIKRAGRILWNEYPWVGQTMRLWIHDEILGQAKEDEIESCLEISRIAMERPIEELPLDPTWGMGEYLSIGTEAKVGRSWGSME